MTSKASNILRAPGAWILFLVLCATGDAAAQAVGVPPRAETKGGWSELALPGGTGGLLTAAGLDPARPRATALLDIIRIIHEVRLGFVPALDERRAVVFSYLEHVEEFLQARAAFTPPTVQLSAAASGNARKSLKALAEAMGTSLEKTKSTYALALVADAPAGRRRASLKAAGLDVEKCVEDLNAGRALELQLLVESAPLPLPGSAWRALPHLGLGWLARLILTDRRASLLYFGLCGMDEETRRYLGANPQVLSRIYESERAEVAALHGGSLHVRSGRVDPPGGTKAAPLWEAIAGERVSEPDKFVLAVLGKDEGRLAHLYDAVDRMEAPGQGFTLGWRISDPGTRMERFKALYSECAAGLSAWDVSARPFTRALFDPAHILLASPLMPDGSPGALGWTTFWQKAFDGEKLPDDPRDDLKDLEKGGPLDAATLVHVLSALSNRTRRQLCEAWCFAQRLFANVPKDKLPDVLVVLRGYSRYSVLVLTLERLGVTDPADYAAAVRRAEQVSQIGDDDRETLAVSLHQGALVLVERARVSRTLSAAAASTLVRSLNRLPLSADGEFLGAVAGWIDTHYLPAIGGRASQDADEQVMAALAGRHPTQSQPGKTVEYEGIEYRVDPASAELERLKAIREKQGGASLQAVLTLGREVRTLSAGVQNVAQLAERIEALKAASAPVLAAQPARATGWSRPADLPDALNDAVRTLSGIRKAQDLRKLDRAALSLQRSADWELARVLVSLAYAAGIGDPESTALVAGDPSVLHEWGVALTDEDRRARMEWAMPKESHDAGGRWNVDGSLLALDVGLGSQALHRLSSDAPPSAPTISDNHRHALTESAVLANAFDYEDADMALLVEALARGRAAVEALAADPTRLADAAVGLDGIQRNLLAWTLVHERERVPAFFSRGDLLWLGRLDRSAVRALDAWGTTGLSYDGRLCLRFPVTRPYSALAGRWSTGLMPTLLPDITLLVAEALHERHLPAALTRSMLLVTTLDFMDRLALAHEDDWLTLAADVERVLASRLDDYLASVTTAGPLVPLRKASGGEHD